MMRRLSLIFILVLLATSSFLDRVVVFVVAEVHELTPEVFEALNRRKITRYYVQLQASCGVGQPNICHLLETQVWAPLSFVFPEQVWLRLRCEVYPDLCTLLSTGARLDAIRHRRHVDFLTVVNLPDRDTRLVELYRGAEANFDALLQYYRTMAMTVDTLPLQPLLPSEIVVHSPFPVDVAVMVLTTDGFVRPDIWEAFVQSGRRFGVHGDVASTSVRLLVHDKSRSPPSCRESSSQYPSNTISVPTVMTNRSTVSLVRAVLQLLRHAIAYGGATYYVLVSGDSVPLVSLPELLRQLTAVANPTASRFPKHAQDAVLSSPEWRQPYRTARMSKSQNWILLHDNAARWFADPAHDHSHNFEIVAMADEYYWINTAQEYVGTSTTNADWTWRTDLPVMYDEWPMEPAARPHWLKRVEAAAIRAEKGPYLFARKITNQTELVLDWMMEEEEAAAGAPISMDNAATFLSREL